MPLTEREKQYRRDYYQRNKEWFKEYRTKYNADPENRKDQLERQRRWYQENKEAHLERTKQWSADNLDKKAAYRRSRRSVIANAEGTATLEQTNSRIEYFGNKCSYCGGPYEEVDHAIPLDKGGSNWPANLRPACQPCNRKKFTKTIWEFMNLPRKERA